MQFHYLICKISNELLTFKCKFPFVCSWCMTGEYIMNSVYECDLILQCGICIIKVKI